jgi:HlyD family secretion protein
VLKVEPQAMAEQTVTTFSVLMILDNQAGLLRPGMNADVEIRVAERNDVVAVPTAALRTMRDIAVASQLVGLTPEAVRAQLGMGGDATGARTAAAGGAAGGRPGSARPSAGRGGPPAAGEGYRFANRYWVFVQSSNTITAKAVETGLTDLDYSEVTKGLEVGETVILLPSSGLVQSQQRLQQRMRQFTSLPGMSRQDNGQNGR